MANASLPQTVIENTIVILGGRQHNNPAIVYVVVVKHNPNVCPSIYYMGCRSSYDCIVFERDNGNSEKKITDNLNLNRCIKNRITNFA
jgi:hypothetical protein